MTQTIKRGEIVEILPEFQDDGDSEFVWVALNNEEKGRLDISPVNSSLRYPPIYTVKREWVRPVGLTHQAADNLD